jgi:predicted Fe-Mo cluster-binding NifX family protein
MKNYLALQMLKLETMKIAIPYCRGRVSPVFDVAENLYLIEARDGREISREKLELSQNGVFGKAGELSGLGVELLICGAISGIQETALTNAGIQVAGFICGDIETVIAAFINGNFVNTQLQMPGCRGRHRRHGRGFGFCGGK